VSFGLLEEEQFEEHCPGSVADPKADAGAFCVYAAEEEEMSFSFEGILTENIPTTHGMELPLFKASIAGEPSHANGTWAVTGP